MRILHYIRSIQIFFVGTDRFLPVGLGLGLVMTAGCTQTWLAKSLTPDWGQKQKPMSFRPTKVALREVGQSDLQELTNRKLTFVDSTGVEWTAPQGTLTDGASVPRIALAFTDGRFNPQFLKAAVIHDAFCQTDNASRCPEQYRTRPWQDVHHMFYEACVANGTPEMKAKLMFAGVWLGGPRWDDPERSLSAVPDDAMQAEFEKCRNWIEENDPTIAEIEAWMDRNEEALKATQHT